MTKLNQIIAIENSVKSKSQAEFTELHRLSSKTPLLAGISKVYTPSEDGGDTFPPENSPVQVKVPDLLEDAERALTRVIDITLTKESANAKAKADVKVGNKVLVADAPVTYLLFLEKKLVDIHTFVSKLPTLDPAVEWSFDDNAGVYRSAVTETVRNKKVLKNHVRAEATEKHPAQVDVFEDSVLQGKWAKTDFSGAISAKRKRELVDRVEELQKAVKYAREEANSTDVTDLSAAKDIFGYLFS
ncbi:hypothetical protein SEA_NICEHOUSE_119 [Rhodococcus phage NiceHouse]|nr:hypothetical protein SEA_NICEHOUSE_119 [Rhodococcus phage NiceHouse]